MTKLSKNIFYNLIGQGIVLVISFAAVRLIFHKLGAEALGIIYFTTSLNSILMALLEMGVSSVVVREVSGHFDLDKSYTKDFMRTFSFFYWGVYMISGLLIFFMAPFFVDKWIHLTSMSSITAISIVRILGITSIMVLPRSFYLSAISGLQKMEFNNFINIVITGLQQVGAFFILFFGGGLMFVIYWLAASYIVEVVVYFFVSAYFFSFAFLVPRFSFMPIKKNLKFISSTALISFFATIHSQADKIVVSKFLPVATLGYYSFAYSSVSQGSLLAGAVSQAAYPSFSILSKNENKNRMLSQYHKLQDFICFSTLPVFAMGAFALMPVLSFLFNEKVAQSLFLPAIFLCVGFYMNGTLVIPYVFSLAVGKPEITAKMNFYALFIVLPVTVLLVYFFGLIGAGLSWICYNIFSFFYVVPRICRECIGIKIQNWYLHILKIFILMILTYGVSWIILDKIANHSIFALISAYCIASIIFLCCSYFLIGKELRETIFHYLRIIKI